jgi:hypothetical protein
MPRPSGDGSRRVSLQVPARLRSATPANVDTAMIDGRMLTRGGELIADDVEAIVRGAALAAHAVRRRAGVRDAQPFPWTPRARADRADRSGGQSGPATAMVSRMELASARAEASNAWRSSWKSAFALVPGQSRGR